MAWKLSRTYAETPDYEFASEQAEGAPAGRG
jgi:hypothetical protein